MFEHSVAVSTGIDAVIDLLNDHRRGDIIGWMLIEDKCGFGRYTQHWSAFIVRLKKTYLKEKGISLWAIPEVGLKLLTVEEQISWRSKKRRARAMRQLIKDVRELGAIPAKEMSPRQAQERAFRIQQTRESRKRILQANRINEALTPPVDPIRLPGPKGYKQPS
jgi:hypothetical protein